MPDGGDNVVRQAGDIKRNQQAQDELNDNDRRQYRHQIADYRNKREKHEILRKDVSKRLAEAARCINCLKQPRPGFTCE
jgi:ribosomal protein L44E